MAPPSGTKRNASDEGEDTTSNKRVKSEPKEDEVVSDDDSVATVVTDEQRLVKLLLSDLESDEDAAVKAFKEIADLCYSGDAKEKTEEAKENRKKAFNLGAHLAILKAMSKFEESSRVQQMGCRALGNIVCWQINDAAETVAMLGGIETALSAMKWFQDDRALQRYGCHLLANLATLQNLSARIADHPDAIPSIVAAMKKFPNEPKIQQWGCMALNNMSKLKVQAHNDKIVEAEGLVVLAQAKTKYPSNDKVQERANKAMKNLLD